MSHKDGDASLAVKQWLDEPRKGRWLLVYGNYDNPKMEGDNGKAAVGEDSSSLGQDDEVDRLAPEGYCIRRYFPSTGYGVVIVTTRPSAAVHIGEVLRLQKLRKVGDSLRILETTSGRKGAPDATTPLLPSLDKCGRV